MLPLRRSTTTLPSALEGISQTSRSSSLFSFGSPNLAYVRVGRSFPKEFTGKTGTSGLFWKFDSYWAPGNEKLKLSAGVSWTSFSEPWHPSCELPTIQLRSPACGSSLSRLFPRARNAGILAFFCAWRWRLASKPPDRISVRSIGGVTLIFSLLPSFVSPLFV